MYHLHTHCRACDYGKPGAQGIKSAPTDKLIEVFDLGVQSLANDFVHDGEPHAGYAPLKVLFCPQCSLAQLSVVVDPKVLYSHYSYVTSPSQMMRDHFIQILSDIKDEAPEAKTVLEIGSNDGRLLHLMRNNGYSVQGIDPAHNLAEIARATGVPTQTGLFGEDLARMFPDYDIIIARHVFCHVDDWHDFIRGLEALCHQETLIFIEVPYVGDTLEKCELDTVYHEHTSYLSIRATEALLKGTSLKIHRIKKYSIHGGAIGIMLRTTESTAPIMGNTWTDNFTVEYLEGVCSHRQGTDLETHCHRAKPHRPRKARGRSRGFRQVHRLDQRLRIHPQGHCVHRGQHSSEAIHVQPRDGYSGGR